MPKVTKQAPQCDEFQMFFDIQETCSLQAFHGLSQAFKAIDLKNPP